MTIGIPTRKLLDDDSDSNGSNLEEVSVFSDLDNEEAEVRKMEALARRETLQVQSWRRIVFLMVRRIWYRVSYRLEIPLPKPALFSAHGVSSTGHFSKFPTWVRDKERPHFNAMNSRHHRSVSVQCTYVFLDRKGDISVQDAVGLPFQTY
jgi:hypothetical protein